MREDLKTTEFLFNKIKKLYPTFVRPDEFDIDCWLEVLEGYSQTEILDALKEYRKNCEYNNAPIPGTFKKYLHHKSEPEAQATQTVAQAAKRDFAWERMAADIEAGCCQNALYVYRDAERIMLNEWLVEQIPFEVVRKMSYASKLKQAQEKGLLNNFDEALRQASLRRFGREFEFFSANDIENQNNRNVGNVNQAIGTLAAHWGI